MSYPDPVYFGDGETSATYRSVDRPPDLGSPPGNSVDHLALGDGTAGAFGLYRWNFGAHVSGPDLHFHRTISESFYILAGTVRIHDGHDWRDNVAGDFVHVPAGGIQNAPT